MLRFQNKNGNKPTKSLLPFLYFTQLSSIMQQAVGCKPYSVVRSQYPQGVS